MLCDEGSVTSVRRSSWKRMCLGVWGLHHGYCVTTVDNSSMCVRTYLQLCRLVAILKLSRQSVSKPMTQLVVLTGLSTSTLTQQRHNMKAKQTGVQ